MNNYLIKEGYRCNLDTSGRAIPYDDDERSAEIYQVKVYLFAARLIRKRKLQSVMDIGCGLGVKLKQHILPVCKNIVGIDREHAIRYCIQQHSFGRWEIDDIEHPRAVFEDPFDLIIAADVIEHLVNPTSLLEYIKHHAHRDTIILLSTPDRDAVSGRNSAGPPINKSHVREWSRREFYDYISSSGFEILKHFNVSEVRIGAMRTVKQLLRGRPLRKCQVAVCQKSE